MTPNDVAERNATTADERRQRLFGDFLRARRTDITPESVGMHRVGQLRRVSGLRREEVAHLANVSADYYTRLEQGRVPAPSETVLGALSEALRLDADQDRYLRMLADGGNRRQQPAACLPTIPPELLLLMEHLGDLPAMIVDRYLDVLTWNATAAALFIDFAKLSPPERNMIRLVFLDAEVRSRFKAWRSAGLGAASFLRIMAALYTDNPRVDALVSELSSADADFRSWWSSQSVVSNTHAYRTYLAPDAGEVELVWQMLRSSADPECAVVVLTPSAGPAGAADLARLVSAASRLQALHPRAE